MNKIAISAVSGAALLALTGAASARSDERSQPADRNSAITNRANSLSLLSQALRVSIAAGTMAGIDTITGIMAGIRAPQLQVQRLAWRRCPLRRQRGGRTMATMAIPIIGRNKGI